MGDRLALARARLLVPAACSASLAIVATVLCGAHRAGRASRTLTPVVKRGPSATLHVLIPAQDEAAALPGLLADLGAQDYRAADGRRSFFVVVVDDHSRDGTFEVALRAGWDAGLGDDLAVIRRLPSSSPDGKASALAAAPWGATGVDAIVVLDADARLDPDFLSRVGRRVAAGSSAFTVRRRTYHAGVSLFAEAQAAEQDLDSIQLRSRIALGGAGEFRGNGMVLTPAALADAGGWPCGSLTEDLDLSTRLAARGRRIDWAAEITAWEAPTATASALARQRLRWAEGSVRRLLALLPQALASRSLPFVAKIDLAIYSGQAVLPPIVLGAALGGLRRRRPGAPLILVGLYIAVGSVLAWAGSDDPPAVEPVRAHPLGPDSGVRPRSPVAPGRVMRAGLGGVFATHWLVAVPAALARIAFRRGAPTFERTRDRVL